MTPMCRCCERALGDPYYVWKRMQAVKHCRACRWCPVPKRLLRERVWAEWTFVYDWNLKVAGAD